MTETILTNARIVLPETVLHGSVVLRDGCIAEVAGGVSTAAGAEDLGGDLLLPGLVELHTDNLETHMQPRPGVHWPRAAAVRAHDSQLAAAGITTVLDAMTVGFHDGPRARGPAEALAEIDRARDAGALKVDHYVHLRCEVSGARLADQLPPLMAGQPRLRLLSVMDHTPGQRQFRDIDRYRQYTIGKYGTPPDEVEARIVQRQRDHATYAAPHRRLVVDLARAHGIPVASHDDATLEQVAEATADGVTVCEFPTTLEAARASRAAGMAVLMGGPNLVLGGSHSGNVSAHDIARAGLLDIVSSDYVPHSLLTAVWLLAGADGARLSEAVATVTRTPAVRVGLTDRGAITPGLRADLIRVRVDDTGSGPIPHADAVWRGGRRVA